MIQHTGCQQQRTQGVECQGGWYGLSKKEFKTMNVIDNMKKMIFTLRKLKGGGKENIFSKCHYCSSPAVLGLSNKSQ